ncbi:MAG: putative glycosyltransferase [Ilumatobacteraceae bacterium]|nr:putative glycosyltransferase [Ilumatobacteraceae bacterium]
MTRRRRSLEAHRGGPLRLAVLCPHFEPDTAPTGSVMTRIVHELVAQGHEVHVVTALPWYRHHAIEDGWTGRWIRRERTTWGSITRVHPFPGDDKTNLARRALGFLGFSALAGLSGLRGGRVDGVLAMSPPLTNGVIGWVMSIVRRGVFVFNIQDVFPDAAIETGALDRSSTFGRIVIPVASWLERFSYRRSDAVTVLSGDLRDNVVAKLPAALADRVRVIPNFVLTEEIRPLDRMTAYRTELGIGDEPVVLYAGNVGFSQSLELVVAAARELPDVIFLINGEGSAKAGLVEQVAGLANVRVGDYQPLDRLAEVLASGDIHIVPLRAGLGRVSVPSKTYSILAAGRPIVAAIDPGTEVPRIIAESGAGVAVPPDDAAAFVAALRDMLADPARAAAMGAAGRTWVEAAASPAAVAEAYAALFRELLGGRRA